MTSTASNNSASDATTGAPGQPTIVQQAGDLEVDLALGTWRRGRIPRTDLPKLIAALAKVGGRTTFDGAEVIVSLKPVVPQLLVEDAGRGFFAKLSGDASVLRMFRNGGALVSQGGGPNRSVSGR